MTRSAQMTQAVFEFVMNSVDEDLLSRLVNIEDQYTVRGRSNGPLEIKGLIGLVQVATKNNATQSFLVSLNFNLPNKIKDFDSTVDFNCYTRATLQSIEN